MGNKEIFATDPRGFPVELLEKHRTHIAQKHPDLAAAGVTEDHFRRAVERPADGCIFESSIYPECDLYYVRFSNYLQIRVVVRFVDNVGEIVTAHFKRNRPKGETIKWMEGK